MDGGDRLFVAALLLQKQVLQVSATGVYMTMASIGKSAIVPKMGVIPLCCLFPAIGTLSFH